MSAEFSVAQIVQTITREAGGTTTSITALCRGLASRGCGVELHVLRVPGTPSGLPLVNLHTYEEFPAAARMGLSCAMRRGIRAAAARVDVLHVHGLWRMSATYGAYAAARERAKLVISPRGMLEGPALAYHALPKRAFWLLRERENLASAACLHATSEQEYLSIRRIGLRTPVAVVPNGAAFPEAALHGAVKKRQSPRELLCLSRLHPLKGIDRLIAAWAEVQAKFPDWSLRIVGTDRDGYLAKLQALVADLRAQRVVFDGPLFGEEKDRAFARASIFVLPSYSENFGNTVAEALIAGTPVVVTQGSPWQGLEERRCGWWISNETKDLSGNLARALSTAPDELAEMGQRGRTWMQEEFSWDSKCADMQTLYRWVAGKCAQAPSFVALD